jgi:hypothetical protein
LLSLIVAKATKGLSGLIANNNNVILSIKFNYKEQQLKYRIRCGIRFALAYTTSCNSFAKEKEDDQFIR